MPEPESRIRINITGNMTIDGVAIYMGFRVDESHIRVLHYDHNGFQTWELMDSAAQLSPTMVMSDEFARALLDSLTRHYQGASDMHTVRSDLLHERGRVDKLIDTIGGIATTIIRNTAER